VPREHNQRDYYDLVDYEEEENPLKGNLDTLSQLIAAGCSPSSNYVGIPSLLESLFFHGKWFIFA